MVKRVTVLQPGRIDALLRCVVVLSCGDLRGKGALAVGSTSRTPWIGSWKPCLRGWPETVIACFAARPHSIHSQKPTPTTWTTC